VLDNGGRSERDELDRRRSAKLTLPATLDRWFITLIVQRYLQLQLLIGWLMYCTPNVEQSILKCRK